MPPIVPTYPIDLIAIYADGVRRARVIHPESGVAVWHGLGAVGEPMRLGRRAGERLALRVRGRTREIAVPEHYIVLPHNPDDLTIVSTDQRGRPTVATFADLRAPSIGGVA